LGRGRYEITLTTLCDNPRDLPKGEITRLYAKKLEEIIYERPENWLWSHKRWKMTLPENTEVIG
jgi:KDO2-lipid IV(A) lauroyltransferase